MAVMTEKRFNLQDLQDLQEFPPIDLFSKKLCMAGSLTGLTGLTGYLPSEVPFSRPFYRGNSGTDPRRADATWARHSLRTAILSIRYKALADKQSADITAALFRT
jgi:hypothetical protein